MIRYSLELALHGLRRSPKSTLLAVVTVALGLAASMTTLVLLHMLSADPLPGRSQHLYLAWVDTVLAKPDNYASLNGITVENYKRIKMADAQALLQAHRAIRQAALAGLDADVSTEDGEHLQRGQLLLGTTSGFMPMMGQALRYGRNWTAAEDATRAPVAVIDVELAQKLFGTGNAVGRSIRLDKAVFRVIGVSTPFSPSPHFYDLDRWVFSAKNRENVFLPYTAALDAGIKLTGADECDATAARKSLFDHDVAHCAWLSYWVELDTPGQVADFRAYLLHYARAAPVVRVAQTRSVATLQRERMADPAERGARQCAPKRVAGGLVSAVVHGERGRPADGQIPASQWRDRDTKSTGCTAPRRLRPTPARGGGRECGWRGIGVAVDRAGTVDSAQAGGGVH